MKKRIICFLLLFILFQFFVSLNLISGEIIKKSLLKAESILKPIKLDIFGNQIYVLDGAERSIKILDTKGNLIKTIGKRGQGPGEFVNATDFYIDKNHIFVLDVGGLKIETFSRENKKHVSTKRILVNNPFKFSASKNYFFIVSIAFHKGQNIIHVLEKKDFKEVNSFLNCYPLKKMDFSLLYKNFGLVSSTENKVYFIYLISNKILEFSEGGVHLNTYYLPLESLDLGNLKIDKKMNQRILKKALNYDIRSTKGKTYILSRDKEDNSLIFSLENGKLKEEFKIKDKLVNFCITQKKIWGINSDMQLVSYEVNL